MNIILNPDFLQYQSQAKNLQERLTELVVEKDELQYRICPSIEADYMVKIGDLEFEASQIELEVHKAKRKVELMRSKTNRGEKFNLEEIEAQLDDEERDYAEKVKLSAHRREAAMENRDYTEQNAVINARIKDAYRKITKKLHPDINPDTTDEQKIIFLKAAEAYKHRDIEELETLALLVDDIAESTDEDESCLDILKEKCVKMSFAIESLEAEIAGIKCGFPYKFKEFLNDEELVKQKQAELRTYIDHLKVELRAYIETIANAML